jgi:diadenosine tetraphosphatase ApaH/serine/threonine PP2A family protein phosphatase
LIGRDQAQGAHSQSSPLILLQEAVVLTALISDIHANREALTATLDQIKTKGADRIIVLGDIVGYGADPQFCCDQIRELQDKGAIVLRGNHDEAAAGAPYEMSAQARMAIEWTREQIDADAKAWLAHLPLSHEEAGTLFVHANGWSPGHWAYINQAADAERSMRRTGHRLTVCGHTHQPAIFHMPAHRPAALFVPVSGIAIPLVETRQWLAIAPAIGQPRDGDPAAGYILLDEARREMTYHRVPYDCERAAQKIRDAGLPIALADRLLKGR